MAAQENFDIGDLVWAKMKGVPFWPGMIANPPTDAKSTSKKAHHYVLFFGSDNYAWILDENIVHHSEEMLQSTSTKKKSNLLIMAIEKISEEASQKAESLIKEKESSEKCEASTSGTGREIAKKQKIEFASHDDDSSPGEDLVHPRRHYKSTPAFREYMRIALASQKAESLVKEKESPEKCEASTSGTERGIAKKRKIEFASHDDDSSPDEDLVHPQKYYKSTPAFRESMRRGLANVESHCEAFIKPSEFANVLFSKISRHDYYDLEPDPALNVCEHDEVVKNKNVKPTEKKIGFIGLGLMGQRLVKNLLTTKHKVTIWNRTTKKCDDFVKAGASLAQTPGDVIEKSDITFCCVSDSKAADNLVFGKCGVLIGLENSTPGSKSYVEMTTMDPDTSIKIADAVEKRGGRYLEAPIVGSTKMAENGNLLILGAGNDDLFVECRSCFFAFSHHAFYLGSEVGVAAKMNLIHSSLMAAILAALGEAVALLERTTIAKSSFLDILQYMRFNSPLIEEKKVAMVSRNFATNTALKYVQRDLNLTLSLSNMCEQQMPVTTATNELFKRAELLNYSDYDASAVFLGAKY